MVHTRNYHYGTDHVVIIITADTQDESYDILCELLKTPPEEIKLFDSETVDDRKEQQKENNKRV
jgi:hypothetical protein